MCNSFLLVLQVSKIDDGLLDALVLGWLSGCDGIRLYDGQNRADQIRSYLGQDG